jgi:hypothetical protein
MNRNAWSLIAVVGVSADEEKYGHRIFRDMLNAGYPVQGVNPKGGFVLGRRIYRDLEELGTKPELVITVVPPAVTERIVEDCGRLGIKNLWMQPGSESGLAALKAEKYGIKTITACFMVQEGLW